MTIRSRRPRLGSARSAPSARAILAIVAAAALLAASGPPARAEPRAAAPVSESDRLIEQGLALREQGKDTEALPLFERALALGGGARARAQLALANQALGHWVEAERGLVEALGAEGDGWVNHNRATLESSLATVQRQLSWLDVQTNVAGAEVSVNGAKVGVTPLAAALRVPAGLVNVQVTAPGYAPALRLVQVLSGEHAREPLVLVENLTEKQPTTIVAEVGGRQTDAAPAAAPAAPLPAASSRDAGRPGAAPTHTRTLAWLALGGGAVLIGGGVAAHVARESNVAHWDDPSCLRGGATREANCGAIGSAAKTDTALAVIGYATGGALVLTSAVLFLRPATAPSATARSFAPACGVSFLALWCATPF